MAETTPWWRNAVIYQVYPRSFADGSGDGVGDLIGVRDRLGAIAELGVDAIWLSPFYRSPQVDGGYDVSDHRDVDPLFGTLDDAQALFDDAHELGVRVIVDLVPNHTSSEHPWFRTALADPSSPERARYVFRPGRGAHGELPPNDWHSVFGGPAWTRVPSADEPADWYLHLFASEQPDLDWTSPEVRAEFVDILRWWLDRGVDGFRIDVAHGLAKDPELPDIEGEFATGGLAMVGHPHWDRDEVHDVYREWRRVADDYDGDRVFVAEAYLKSPERLARYVRPDELHTAFNFRFLMADWRPDELREAIEETLRTHDEVGAPATWVLSNHDVVREVTRYGGGVLGTRRARAAALLMLALPGSAYVYQGEELGLPEVEHLPDDVRQDPTHHRTGGAEPGRDGCRVPLPWEGDTAPFGFSGDAAVEPWLPQPADWARLTREAQRDEPDSMLRLYRDALARRRQVVAAAPGPELRWLDLGRDVLAFERPGGFVSITNLGADPLDLADLDDVLIGTAPQDLLCSDGSWSIGDPLPSDTTLWSTGGR
ncbi:MAG: glycoside hydrolase family 13 protein [Actinomycetota bacterium]|nr:glycoside hydrolase family 13 protein [Actinomycetota bacterium]